MQRLKVLTFLMAVCLSALADSVGTWKSYLSYTDIEDIEVAGNDIFVVASGNLYSYNKDDGSLATYSPVDLLSDMSIKKISWNSSCSRLVVIYDNSNIDIVTPSGDAINVPELYNKQMTGDKTIYSVKQYGQYAYICTGFGIVKVDIKNGYICDTYNLKVRVNDVAIVGDYIYAQENNVGMKYASLSSNLSDPNSWEDYDTLDFLYIDNINGKLVRYDTKDFYYEDPQTRQRTHIASQANTFRKCRGNKIVGINGSSAIVIDSDMKMTTYTTPLTFSAIAIDNSGDFWAPNSDGKLTQYAIAGSSLTAATTGVIPDGPASRYSYKLCLNNGALYMTAGAWSFSLDNAGHNGQIMYLDNDTWDEFEHTGDIVNVCGRYRDINTVVIDPLDSKHAFAGGFNGLYEFYDGKFKKRWGTADGLQTYDNNPGKEYHVIVTGLKYDSEGNLYILNTHTAQPLFRLTTNGVLEHLATATTLDGDGTSFDLDGLTISGNNLWFVNERNPIGGIYRYAINEDKLYYIYTFSNQDGTLYTPGWVYDTASDRNGNLWIATNLGPFYIKPDDVSSWTFTQYKVPRNDGTNYADYLLTGINTRCIAIDDANRKWIGTDDQGVFVISDDCNTQLYHFTEDNSPLLSNRIYDIAINESTGMVYFTTDNGLCAYQSEVTTSNDEMTNDNVWAYPNPVEPGYSGNITITGLEFNSQVIITTASGEKVIQGTSNGGSFSWNGCNSNGEQVASGVYMVHVAKSDGSKGIVTKIAIVR